MKHNSTASHFSNHFDRETVILDWKKNGKESYNIKPCETSNALYIWNLFLPPNFKPILKPNFQLLYRRLLMLMSRSIYLSGHVKIFIINNEHLFVFFVFVSQLYGIRICLEFFGYSWFQFLVINVGRGQQNPSVGVMAFNFKFSSMISAIQRRLRRIGASVCCNGRRHVWCAAVRMSGIGRLAMVVL